MPRPFARRLRPGVCGLAPVLGAIILAADALILASGGFVLTLAPFVLPMAPFVLPTAPFAVTESPRVDPRPPKLNMIRAAGEVQADRVWSLPDSAGHDLTGRGMVVCDVDLDIDIFHPMLFRADGGVFVWLDVDSNGGWSPGDAVDLDGDGLPGVDETLAWLPAAGILAEDRDTTRFQPGYDFLFNDANRNGARDFGPEDFAETDPCYGERLFVADDADRDGYLSPGEALVGLGTSKVRAIYRRSLWRRGENLIEYPATTYRGFHGTSVCGVLAGGWPGLHRLTGIAPGVDLLFAGSPGRDAFEWAQDEGADVILYEFGGASSDGSSSRELTVNELAEDGIIFVAAAGNERRTATHVVFSEGVTRDFENRRKWAMQIYFFWIGESPPVLRIEGMDGESLDAWIGDREWRTTNWAAELTRHDGPGELKYLDVTAWALDENEAEGIWRFSFPGWKGVVHGMHEPILVSNRSGWVDDDGKYTVTSPGTADSAITVAAYDNDEVGRIAWFSGEGPRVDGRPVMDIAAPGVFVQAPAAGGPGTLSPTTTADFFLFTGTSAAVPFVAGAAALLKQAFPEMDSGLFRELLRRGAGRDSLTGNEDQWGAGRLRIQDALIAGLEHHARTTRPADLALTVTPNPSRGTTRLSWPAAAGGTAEVRVFSVDGRLVWETSFAPTGGRIAEVSWDGRNRLGTTTPAGVYFAHVREGDRIGVTRLVRLR